MSKFLSTDQILNADDRKRQEVPVPEWGGVVLLRSLTGTERDRFESTLQQTTRSGRTKQNMENFRARLIALCAINEEGELLFGDTQSIRQLGQKSAAALQRLYNACNELNGFSDEDVEELTEGFDKAPDGASTSG